MFLKIFTKSICSEEKQLFRKTPLLESLFNKIADLHLKVTPEQSFFPHLSCETAASVKSNKKTEVKQ